MQTTDSSLEPRDAAPHGWLGSIRAALRGTHQDFTEGSIGRAIALLAIPMVMEMSMESLFALVDVFFVSRLGAAAVAAVGLTESLLTIMYTVAMGISMGATALVARRTGEKDAHGASVAGAQAVWLALGVAVPLGIAGALLAPTLLRLMGASPEVIATGGRFTAIMLGGNVVILLLFVLNGVFRGAGDAAIAMRALWLANAVNIVIDPCLILGLGPFPQLGVTGAAVATTTGRAIGVLYLLRTFLSGKGRVALRRDTARVEPGVISRILRVALGGMGQYLIGTASWIALVRIVSQFGSDALAGYTVAMRVVMVALLPAWGMSNAAATLVGQNLGAGKPDRAERSVWRTAFYNMLFLGAVAVTFIFTAERIIGAFTSDPSVSQYGVQGLRTISYGFVLYAVGMVVTQSFNGAGDTSTPTALNVICFWLIQLPIAYGLSTVAGLGPRGAFLAVAIAYSANAVLGVLAFRRGKWKERKV